MQQPPHSAHKILVTHRSILAIAVPMTLAYVTTPLLGLTSTSVIGHSGGAIALAGLAIAAAIFDLLFSTLNFLRMSTTALVAQAKGRDDEGDTYRVLFRAFILSFAFGFCFIFLSPLLAEVGLAIMGADGLIADVARQYFFIRILAAPLSLGNFTLLGFVLGRGQGRFALVLQIILNGVNIALAILLGLYWGWGVKGVAIATVAGEFAAFCVGFGVIFFQMPKGQMPGFASLRDGGELKKLFALNRDILIRTFALMGTITLLTRLGTGFGAVTLAANAILMNFFLASSFFLDGFANAAEQIVGETIGAGARDSFYRAVKLTGLWSLALAAVLAMLYMLFGAQLIFVMTSVEAVQEAARTYLPFAAFTALTGALAWQMDGVFVGAAWSGDMRNMMLAAFAAYLFALALLVPFFGNAGLWLAFNIFLACRGLFLALRLRKNVNQTF